jgi:serine/threonine-protein kinase
MPSDSTQWRQLDQLLDELLDLPEEQRTDAIATLRDGNPALAKRAEKFLSAAMQDNSLEDLASGIAPDLLAEFANEDVQDHIDEQLGPYRIVAAISRGGMGLVYRAVRTDGSYEQSVAIKLLPASIAGERSRALFERERRLLARLEHPNIARILDAGITDKDMPYFVMELVDGERIDEYAQSHALTQASILSLFLRLCDALVYCHQSTVVHGDIKPANVLVADGRVRLVDFGIGQLLEDDADPIEAKRLIAYSPGFAAPEQILGETPTVACDVYSLGALLRHLIVGDRKEGALSEAAVSRTPSSKDLAAIINCCIDDDPAGRYLSVDALRGDVQALLNNYPVRARNSTRMYRSQKFVQRNKILVGSIVLALISLLLGLGATLWQYQIAKTEAFRAEQSNAFLTSLFEHADPVVAGESEVSLRQIIDDAASRIDADLEHLPSVRSEIYLLLGNAYFGIGQYDNAFTYHQKADDLFRTLHAPPHIDIVKAQNALGADHTQKGEYSDAESLHRNAIDQLEQLKMETSQDARVSWTNLGQSLAQSNPEVAREAMIKAHTINLDLDPGDSAALARSLGNIASGYRAERNIEKSAHFHELALEMATANSEKLAPDILNIRCNLALDYGTLGQYLKARQAQLECNRLTAKRFGPDHPANVSNLNNLGALDLALGHLKNAELSYLQALTIAERKLAPMAFDRMAVEINYAVVNWHSGRAAEAEASLRDVLIRMETSVGADHAASGRVRGLLGRVILERGDVDSAKNYIENSLDGLIPYWRSDALLWRAEVELALDNRSAAREYATESLTIRQELPHYTVWQIAEAEWVLSIATDDSKMRNRSREIFRRDLPPEHFRRTMIEHHSKRK